ncbi:hypothetical protein XCR_0516 [Xanthomonas campestris pv. raphani 756C]|nr:hypothetical protein XCR_0516 [Xanthomonas campestris pv. raphani 756C]
MGVRDGGRWWHAERPTRVDAAMDQHGIVASGPCPGKATTGGCFIPQRVQSLSMQV